MQRRVSVAKAATGYVIGRNGINIREIERVTNTQIEVNNPRDNDVVAFFTIHWLRDVSNLDDAERRILKLESNAPSLKSADGQNVQNGRQVGQRPTSSSTSANHGRSTGASPGPTDRCTLFVRNIDFRISEAEIRAMFQQCGPVKWVKALVDKNTNRPKGCAFVDYYDNRSAEAAIQRFNGAEINGRRLAVEFRHDRAGGTTTTQNRGASNLPPPLLDELTVQLQSLSLQQEKKEIVILLLGRTGVGKSTFVNGFVNYLRFASLDEAIRGEKQWVIPIQFTITDSAMNSTEVRVGYSTTSNANSTASKNEHYGKAGDSVTQQPMTYVIPISQKVCIKLIDTPGIGDTRGLEYDKSNLEATMQHLKKYPEIHGIIILSKPNEKRRTPEFCYCIRELLTQLHKNARRNMCFCFTYCRETHYKPGASVQLLNVELEDANVKLTEDNVFYFDNEAVRYLAALQCKVPFSDEDELRGFRKSWDKSVNEMAKLIEHLQELDTGHDTKETLTVNMARQLIVDLTEPIADVAKNIQLNIALLEEAKQKLANGVENLPPQELPKIMQVEMVTKNIPYPQTVCRSLKCVEFHSNRLEPVYKSICHKQCYLKGIKTGSYPQEGLRQCSAMSNPKDAVCKVCSCSYRDHMHICYILEQNYVEDQQAQDMIRRGQTKDVLADLKDRQEKYQACQDKLTTACSRLAQFVREHAITPYNDALENYIAYLIETERRLVNGGKSDSNLMALNKTLERYRSAKATFNEAVKTNGAAGGKLVSLNDVERLIEELKRDPVVGQKITRLLKSKESAEQKSVKANVEIRVPMAGGSRFKKN